MSVRRNILLNSLANILAKTVRVGEQLLLVPFFLTAWGAAYYGEWLTLSIIPSVLAFSDLGFGSAAASSFVLSYSAGNKEKAFNIFHIATRITALTIILGVVLSLCIMLGANYTGLLEKSLIAPNEAIWALSLMMAARLISFYNQLFEALYRAKQRAALSTNLGTADGFSRIALGITALYLDYGVVGFACSQLLSSLLFNTLYMSIGYRILGESIKGKWIKSEAVEMIRKGLGFMFTPIWQSIYFQGSTFAVRMVLGAESVAIFNTVRTVCRSVNQLYSIVNGSVFPELQYQYGAGNTAVVHKVFIRSIQVVLVIAILGVLFLCTVGPYLYAWWTKNELTVSNQMWYIFMIGILFNAVWWTAGSVFRVINQPFKFAMYGLVSAIISTACSFILSYPLGLTGAAIGYVLMDVLMAFLVLPYACKCLEVGMKKVFKIYR